MDGKSARYLLVALACLLVDLLERGIHGSAAAGKAFIERLPARSDAAPLVTHVVALYSDLPILVRVDRRVVELEALFQWHGWPTFPGYINAAPVIVKKKEDQ